MDIKLIRDDPEAVRLNLERRHDREKLELLERVVEDDTRWRELTTRVNDLRARRNKISSEIGRVMKEGGDASSLRQEASRLPTMIDEVETERDETWERVRGALMRLPNILHESVPYGAD